MKYRATCFDHVRWRSETLTAEIREFVTLGFPKGSDIAHLGWHVNDEKTGQSLSLELSRGEVVALHQLLSERLAADGTL